MKTTKFIKSITSKIMGVFLLTFAFSMTASAQLFVPVGGGPSVYVNFSNPYDNISFNIPVGADISSYASSSSTSSSTARRTQSSATTSQSGTRWVNETYYDSCPSRCLHGKCLKCNETGWITSFGNRVKCSFCDTYANCNRCHGTGKIKKTRRVKK